MMFEESLVNELCDIDWFSNVGEVCTLDQSFVQLKSWSDSESYFSSDAWEGVTLEARNSLTSYLHDRYLSDFQRWNEITKSAKEILNNRVMPNIEALILPVDDEGIILSCIRWDLLGCLMENAYRHCKGPVFFSHLLDVYRQGNFPCGWDGEWPGGKLIVF